jgi:tetratricopeptide (TPR) repeat protein
MTPESMDIIARLFKALIFVPMMALIAWWLFTNLLDKTLVLNEALIGFALLGLAFFIGVVSIIQGDWGFLWVIALVYLLLLGLACWEYIYWRRREREHCREQIEVYQAAIETDPTNAAAYSFLGAAHLRLRNFEEAETAFNKALALDPESKKDKALLKRTRERRAYLPRRWPD